MANGFNEQAGLHREFFAATLEVQGDVELTHYKSPMLAELPGLKRSANRFVFGGDVLLCCGKSLLICQS